MELKKQMFDLLNSELDILAYEQKKLNEYKLSESPSLKAIETRQRIIDQRLDLFNKLNDLILKVDKYFNKTILNLYTDGAKGYYLPAKWQVIIREALKNQATKKWEEAEADYQNSPVGSSKELLAEVKIAMAKETLRNLPFKMAKLPTEVNYYTMTKEELIKETEKILNQDLTLI